VSKIKAVLANLLFVAPGVYMALQGKHDLFAAVAIGIIAYLLALMTGSVFAFFLVASDRKKTAPENEQEKVKTNHTVGFWIWIAFVAAGLIFGGTTYLGVAIYGSIIGALDKNFRPATYAKIYDDMLK
jgi:peptidoglycan/LPS O-acetylase OafA/YrhL